MCFTTCGFCILALNIGNLIYLNNKKAESKPTEEKSTNENEEKSTDKNEENNSNIDDVSKVMSSEELMDVFRSFKRHDSEQITVGKDRWIDIKLMYEIFATLT